MDGECRRYYEIVQILNFVRELDGFSNKFTLLLKFCRICFISPQ